MSQDKFRGIIYGAIVTLILATASGAMAMAFDTRERLSVTETRIEGQEKRLESIESKLDMVLSRLPPR